LTDILFYPQQIKTVDEYNMLHQKIQTVDGYDFANKIKTVDEYNMLHQKNKNG
jgi:hypothetical protein